jgi:hypothetical protein
MTYSKPAITNVAEAIAAVQSQGANKMIHTVADFDPTQSKATSSAYESDE